MSPLRLAVCLIAFLPTLLFAQTDTTQPAGNAHASVRLVDNQREGSLRDSALLAWSEQAGAHVLYPSLKTGPALSGVGSDGQAVNIRDFGQEQPARYGHLTQSGEQVYAMWWRKTPPKGDKYLYFSGSTDAGKTFSDARPVNTGGGVLAVYDLAVGEQGNLALVYLDERHSDYAIYFNQSKDYGKSWKAQDVRLDSRSYADGFKVYTATEPRLSFVGKKIIATWKDKGQFEKDKFTIRLVSRTSHDLGATWDAPVVVYEHSDYILADEAELTDGTSVYYAGVNPEGIFAFSTRDGKAWKSYGPVGGSAHVAATQLRMVDSRHHLHFVFVAKSGYSKDHIYYARLNKDSGKWVGEAVLIGGDRKDLTRALSPSLAMIADKTVAVVWQDYANLRPGVMLNYSVDDGQTWMIAPLPVSKPGGFRDVFPNIARVGRDKAGVVFARFNSDAPGHGMSVHMQEFTIDPNTGKSSLPELAAVNADANKERLKKRVEQFWSLRVEDKVKETYEFYDPYYRARVQKDEFSALKHRIKFNEFVIGNIDINNNIAMVEVGYQFNVPETIVQGKPFSVEPTKDVLKSRWLWMDNEWYLDYKPAMGESFLRFD